MRNMAYLDKRPNIDIQTIPERAFIPVIRRRNILKAQIDPGKGVKEDILIQSPMGDSMNIQRKELIRNYRYLQNKKINLHGWRRDTTYTVYQQDGSQMFAMQVPVNLTATVNGSIANSKQSKSGDYIVCYGGADGKVDKRTAHIIQAKMFHKMFSIPNNEVIQRHRGKHNKQFNPPKRFIISLRDVQRTGKPGRAARSVIPNTASTAGQAPKQAPKIAQPQSQRPNQAANALKQQARAYSNQNQAGVQQPTNPVYKVNAATLPGVDKNIARPMNAPKQNNIHTVGKLLRGQTLVGFILYNGKSYKRVNTTQMKALIQNGTVTDVMVQKNSYGVEYFRGNGIQIECLPSQQV